MKKNIRICVIGLGWNYLATPWSKSGIELTSNELMNHLKLIIEQERTRNIPVKPPPDIPKRKDLPQLGTKTINIQDLDINHQSNTQSFEHNAINVQNERETLGFEDRYAEIQPTSRPNIDIHLLGERLEICEKYYLEEGGTDLRCSQGEVVTISNGSNILKPGAHTAKLKAGEGVMIKWDTNEAHGEPVTFSPVYLLKSKWNPKGNHSEGCWGFDLSTK